MGTRSFGYTGSWQRWVVPAGVKAVETSLSGAGSGTRRGGSVTGRLVVSPGQVLYVLVGQAGRAPTGAQGGAGGFGGGAAGGTVLSNSGGWGGGGATAIRMSSSTGTIRAVAGGAAGNSGDGGLGGQGGALIGGFGSPGNAGPGVVGNATGGTQAQGGNKGTSSAGVAYEGNGAGDVALSTGGVGGGVLVPAGVGGGGGGGGYRAGGGGQAGAVGVVPAGGGGGGSNYVAGLISSVNRAGGGAVGNGEVLLSWVDPPPANQPPSPPTEVKVDGQDAVDEQITKSVGTVAISAKIDDPNPTQTVRLEVRYSTTSDFSGAVGLVVSAYGGQASRRLVHLTGLVQNTRYYVRLYTRDSKNRVSLTYKGTNFWTNRAPLEPVLVAPADNVMIPSLTSAVFSWQSVDPDSTEEVPVPQNAYQIKWRETGNLLQAPGNWSLVQITTPFETYVADPGTYKSNTFYEWTVRTQDPQGAWGPWASTNSFFSTGTTTPPRVTSPIKDEAQDIIGGVLLEWDFRDPDVGDLQSKADVRYRPIGTPEWFTLFGTTTSPGGTSSWLLPGDNLRVGTHYEWQVRTYDTLAFVASEWSSAGSFWTTLTPGSQGVEATFPEFTVQQESLGCGTHRVFIYDRGGQVMRGEITPLTRLQYNRKRDDISNAIVDTNGFGVDCGVLLGSIRSWIHEIVIFRDGVRVWEGPITRITYTATSVEIEAKDVMAYVYRRIMRQGYDDSYRIVNGQQLGQRSVVERATQITMNALAPNDPNVLGYLTQINLPDDAGQSRVVADYSRTAWEEIDDLAATAGLDYTVAGRRIIYWDTHRPLGRLTEMRDENFSDPPVVTEYGMQTADYFGVTNNSGVWGAASRDTSYYGGIEQLASAYGETEGGETETLTSAARESLERTLATQAERNISDRFPTPIVVRVPDNSSLNPESLVTINQLIPGVWIPLRARATVRDVAQWQKLDAMGVEQTPEGGEKITVVMSPAPNGGEDPDATPATEVD